MPSDEWPVEIDGNEFYPIPESWIEHGSDQNRGSPRIYAVAVASGVRNLIVIRYASPDGRAVKVTTNGAENPSGGGTVPASLANHGDWPRSMVPSRHVEPTGLLRKAEIEHFQEMWADRIREDDGAEADRQLVADGGTVNCGTERLGYPSQRAESKHESKQDETDAGHSNHAIIGITHLDVLRASSRSGGFLSAINSSDPLGLERGNEAKHQQQDWDHVDHISRYQRPDKKTKSTPRPDGDRSLHTDTERPEGGESA
ncbi:hypothetical protein [Halosimplex sp. TS25]|uniref:hypothetical protein n=1 Tax=Halosimplex rarum TaxID=3396619 RepID=UPI0039EC2B1D